MRRLVLLGFALAVFAAGCGGGLKSKLIGTWKVDVASVKMPEIPEAMKNNPQFAQMMEQTKQQMAAGRIEFKADGSVIPTGMGSQQAGKWSLDGNQIKLVDDKGKEDTNVKATINEDGTRIHLQPQGAQATGQMANGIDLVKA